MAQADTSWNQPAHRHHGFWRDDVAHSHSGQI